MSGCDKKQLTDEKVQFWDVPFRNNWDQKKRRLVTARAHFTHEGNAIYVFDESSNAIC